jgi:hypothetical protein
MRFDTMGCLLLLACESADGLNLDRQVALRFDDQQNLGNRRKFDE